MNLPRRTHFILVTLITTGILLLIATGVHFYTKNRLTSELVKRYLEQESIVALQISAAAQDDLNTSNSFLSALAVLPVIQEGDVEACNEHLHSISSFVPRHINHISRINDKGVITCSTAESLVGLNSMIFDAGLRTLITDPDHRPTVGELSIPPGSDEYAIGYYLPIRNKEGAFIGALKAATNISTIREQYERNPAFHFVGEPILIDHNGSILYSAESAMLNKNVFVDELESDFIEKNTLEYILRLSLKNENGSLNYSLDEKDYIAIYRRIDILPGHSWTLVLTSEQEEIQEVFLSNSYEIIRWLMIGSFVIFFLILSLFIFYITRNLIRPEAPISTKHDKHMKRDLTQINQAFSKVTQKLGKLETHLEKDMNALHEAAEKKERNESGK